MRGLLPYAWRSLRARPARTGLTIAGIAVGVGVLVAGLAVDTGISASIDRTVASIAGRADLRITGFAEAGLSRTTVDTITAVPGVAVAAPAIERRAPIAPSPDRPALVDPVTVLGIDPSLERRVHDLSLLAGSPLLAADEPSALVGERLARSDGLELGMDVALVGAEGLVRVRVIGILAGDGPVQAPDGRSLVVPIGTAARLAGTQRSKRSGAGRPPRTQRAGDRDHPGRCRAGRRRRAVVGHLGARQGARHRALRVVHPRRPRDDPERVHAGPPRHDWPPRRDRAVRRRLPHREHAVDDGHGTVPRARPASSRRRQPQPARTDRGGAGGAPGRGRVAHGSGARVVLGSLLADALRRGGGVPLDGPVFEPGLLLGTFLLGVAVTLAAAAEPARRAAAVSPVEALRARARGAAGGHARRRWLVAILAVVAIVGAMAFPAGPGPLGAGRALIVDAVLIAAVLLAPAVLVPLGRAAGAPFARVLRLEERLARAAIVRDRSRSGLTVGALVVGLTMVVALGAVAANARLVATAWIHDVVPGDEVLTAIAPVPLDDFSPEPDLEAVDGVASVSPIATFDLAFRGQRVRAAAMSGADLAADGRLTFLAGERAAALAALDAGGAVILPRAAADRLDVGLDDVLAVPAVDGALVELSVVGIVERSLRRMAARRRSSAGPTPRPGSVSPARTPSRSGSRPAPAMPLSRPSPTSRWSER